MTIFKVRPSRIHAAMQVGGLLSLVVIVLSGLKTGGTPESKPPTVILNNPPVIAGLSVGSSNGVAQNTPSIDSRMAGRLLVNELKCAACHSGLPSNHVKSKQAPRLAGITQRVSSKWLRAFIIDPAGSKPGTTMPSMFPDSRHGKLATRDVREIDALVHFLGSTKLSNQLATLPRRSTADRGRLLYHRYGCVACHGADPISNLSGEISIAQRPIAKKNSNNSKPVPLFKLESKYSLRSLTDFLLDPLAYRPGGRMPNMKLNLQDASDIAAYLVQKTGDMDNKNAKDLPAFRHDPAKAKMGKSLFTSIGCASCHVAQDGKKPIVGQVLIPAKIVASKTKDICSGRPGFSLSKFQRQAIVGIWGKKSEAEHKFNSKKSVEFSMRSFNCFACHQRDELGGPGANEDQFTGDEDLGDEGRLPPILTDVGQKLTGTWLKKIFEGSGDVRPYLHTRMPNFGMDNVAHLPADFDKADRQNKIANETRLDRGDAEIGRLLVGTQGGLGCIMCHDWKDKRSLGMRALNISDLSKRLRPAWFERNLLNPASVRPRTLMPTYWPDGKGVNKTHFNGDAHKQIASIWMYLHKGEKPPPGYPAKGNSQYELEVTDSPIVMRTFTKAGGTHSIVVGNPQGVHYIYDTKSGRLVTAWRDRFIDAYSTWYDRFVTPVEPLGASKVSFSDTPLLASVDEKQPWPKTMTPAVGYQYRGYKLDKSRVPTFLYALKDASIEDRFDPILATTGKSPGLRRTITVNTKTAAVRFLASVPKGVRIQIIEPKKIKNNGVAQPLKPGKTTIVLEYRW